MPLIQRMIGGPSGIVRFLRLRLREVLRAGPKERRSTSKVENDTQGRERWEARQAPKTQREGAFWAPIPATRGGLDRLLRVA